MYLATSGWVIPDRKIAHGWPCALGLTLAKNARSPAMAHTHAPTASGRISENSALPYNNQAYNSVIFVRVAWYTAPTQIRVADAWAMWRNVMWWRGVRRMRSSLDRWDVDIWHSLPGYSPQAARCLERAYTHLARRRNQVADYLHAANTVAPCIALSMADPQRLRIYYVEALAHAAANQDREALEWIDEAIELAIALDDRSALAALLYLRGAENASGLRYGDAADDYDESRTLLRDHSTEEEPYDVATELHLTTQQAGARFLLGQYERTEQLLDEARGLIPLVPDRLLDVMAVPWMEAHLHRWRGAPENALRPALAAAAAYATGESTASAARIQVVVADIILDLAAVMPSGTDRDALLAMARPHVALALHHARGSDDAPGVVLGDLANVRVARLQGTAVDRLGIVEHQEQVARGLGDHALLAQACTARGDELAARSEEEAARGSYRQALAILDGSDMPALAVWAWRGLRRLDERHF